MFLILSGKVSYSFSMEVISDLIPSIVVKSVVSGVSQSLTLPFSGFLT